MAESKLVQAEHRCCSSMVGNPPNYHSLQSCGYVWIIGRCGGGEWPADAPRLQVADVVSRDVSILETMKMYELNILFDVGFRFNLTKPTTTRSSANHRVDSVFPVYSSNPPNHRSSSPDKSSNGPIFVVAPKALRTQGN